MHRSNPLCHQPQRFELHILSECCLGVPPSQPSHPPPLPSNPTDPFYQNFSNRAYSACVQNKNDKAWYAFSEENGCIDYQLGASQLLPQAKSSNTKKQKKYNIPALDELLQGRLSTPDACILFYKRRRKVKSLKEVCLLHIAKLKRTVDVSVLPSELREAVEEVSPNDVRYVI